MFLSKKPSGVYYIVYTKFDGKRALKSTFETKKPEATKKLIEFSKRLDFIEQNKVIPITLKNFYWEFLKYSESVHTNKTTLTHHTTKRFVINYFGENIQLKDITKKSFHEYLLHRMKESSIYSARRDHINFSSAMSKAVLDGYLITNPCKGIKRFKIPEKQPLFYTKEDLSNLLSAINDIDMQHITEFAFNTGLRQGELINLTWDQIDFNTKILTLNNRESLTKSKRVRSIPLNETALNILKERLKQNHNFIFTLNKEKIRQVNFSQKFKRYVHKAKLNPKLNFHSLRHSFASILIQKGASIFHVSKLLGHSDIKTTMIYSHVRTEDLRETTNLI